MKNVLLKIAACSCLSLLCPAVGFAAAIDVLHYDAHIEPDIANSSIQGKVLIRFVSNQAATTFVEFDRGELTIDAAREKTQSQEFEIRESRLKVVLSRPAKSGETREIEITYHGMPKRGIRFVPAQRQVYTVFSTSQWMVCIDAPEDKASLSLSLTLPEGLTPFANGRLVSQRDLPGRKAVYQWEQTHPVSTYLFGFAAGPFHTVTEKVSGVKFQYVSAQFSGDELHRIFHDTPDMLEFYQSRAGMSYADDTYTQVLASGSVEQELSSFTELGESYGNRVLNNDHAIWLGAHELAHQWWGNMVTCRDWNHFWLNEGMASFMADAYLEHRFGRAEYLLQIESHRMSYEKVRLSGLDKPLVFPDWLHPTAQDRTLVYDKGAYVLHLLREEMGEPAFWAGIRSFTREYFGKSVETVNFQNAMERSSGKNLAAFFAKWIYLN